MKILRHYFKILVKILSSEFNDGKINMIVNYSKLIIKSIIYHKLSRREDVHSRVEKLLGFEIHFFTYQQLVNLFEEIFIYQVYNFTSKMNNPVIIDCGSNIGLSILFFKKKYPFSQIIAFEPDVETFKLLEKNVKTNNLTNVTLYNIALSDSAGQLDLYKASLKNGSLNMSILKSDSKPFAASVAAEKLSDYINNTIDMLKIDIEGAELKIITDLIEQKKTLLIETAIIEYHPLLTNLAVEKFISNFDSSIFTIQCKKDELHGGATEVLIHLQKIA